jgi:hypothetical protein
VEKHLASIVDKSEVVLDSDIKTQNTNVFFFFVNMLPDCL